MATEKELTVYRKIGEVKLMLDDDLAPAVVKTHPYSKMSYISAHTAINNANRIFGYAGWSYRVSRDPVFEPNSKLWYATVEITVTVVDDANVKYTFTREDVGCQPVAVNRKTNEITAEAHDTAIKGAVSDAFKRAFRSLGNQFGNSLYGEDDFGGETGAEKPKGRMAEVAKEAFQKDLHCQNCGNLITGFDTEKRSLTAEQFLTIVEKEFGKGTILCRQCYREAKDAKKAAEAA